MITTFINQINIGPRSTISSNKISYMETFTPGEQIYYQRHLLNRNMTQNYWNLLVTSLLFVYYWFDDVDTVFHKYLVVLGDEAPIKNGPLVNSLWHFKEICTSKYKTKLRIFPSCNTNTKKFVSKNNRN